jgi:hypothetical protein
MVWHIEMTAERKKAVRPSPRTRQSAKANSGCPMPGLWRGPTSRPACSSWVSAKRARRAFVRPYKAALECWHKLPTRSSIHRRPLLLPPERAQEVSARRGAVMRLTHGTAVDRRQAPARPTSSPRTPAASPLQSVARSERPRFPASPPMHCAIGVPFCSTLLKFTSCQCTGKWIQVSRDRSQSTRPVSVVKGRSNRLIGCINRTE